MNDPGTTPRDERSLDGEWGFRPDPYGIGADRGWQDADRDDGTWGTAPVPGCFEAASPNLEFYLGAGWYRRRVAVPAAWRGRRIVLRFGAVHDRARVWLDGELLGENRDPFLPFEFDVTAAVTPGGEHLLVVAADNRHHQEDLPGMHTGWRHFGGILREVGLHATPPCHLARTHVVAAPTADGGEVEFALGIENASPRTADVRPSVTVRDTAGTLLATLEGDAVSLPAGRGAEVKLSGTVAGVEPWSPASPTLYQASARLDGPDGGSDEVRVRFGFRTVGTSGARLLLNGGPLWLQGWNRHEDSPRTGGAADHELARQDLERMKAAGANFVRLCHYPHHPRTLDLCDELGLLALAEIPLYYWRDREEGARAQPARAAAAARQLERMIARDRNHPSVIIWSVSNETDTKRQDVRRDNEELIRRARALDPTRLCAHVSNKPDIAPFFDEDDVICVNRYPGLGLARDAADPADLAAAAARWRADLADLHRRYPAKPILATEFGYVSLAGCRGLPYGEDVQARVLSIEFEALRALPQVCGAAIWCWADHAWPKRQSPKQDFLATLLVSPYGCLTRDRRELEAFREARRLFAAEPEADRPLAEECS